MIPLTIQKPDLVCDRQVPVLYHPFRQDELYYRGERTARKIANTIASSTSVVRKAALPTYPMISSPAKRI